MSLSKSKSSDVRVDEEREGTVVKVRRAKLHRGERAGEGR